MSESDRGFASMEPDAHRRIASAGGKAAHHYGTGRRWTRDEAREAGRKGKAASDAAKRRLSPWGIW